VGYGPLIEPMIEEKIMKLANDKKQEKAWTFSSRKAMIRHNGNKFISGSIIFKFVIINIQ
jgi:hypothetical protein